MIKKIMPYLCISELLYGLIIFILLQSKHLTYITYSNGFINLTGITSLIENYSAWLIITLSIISWIIIPTLIIYLITTYKATQVNKETLKIVSIIFLCDGIIWSVINFFIAIPQFRFETKYIVAWLFGLIFLIFIRFCITFIIGTIEMVCVHLFYNIKKYVSFKN